MDDVRLIADIDALRAIAEPTRVAILEQLAEPQSVSQLARALDVPRTRLYHHISLLRRSNIIEVVARRRVGAMTERIYAPTARTFRPSPELLTSGDMEERLDALSTLLFDATRSDFRHSVLSGRATLEEGTGPRQVAIGRSIGFLSAARAEEFIAELEALAARFDEAHRTDGEGQPFAFSWVFYPASRALR